LVVEVLRGDVVESRHEVDVVAVDADGSELWSRGDGRRSVLPRSSLKPIQALPLFRSGAADARALSSERLAIACASHGGEPAHIAVLTQWLDDAGLDIEALECGSHPPSHQRSAEQLVQQGEQPTPLHNTCSGKHVGFLSVCAHLGISAAGYLDPTHPLQAEVLTPAVEELCGISLAHTTPGVDGCGVPVWAMPLDRLAGGWAALAGTTEGQRIFEAMRSSSFMVAGTDRACTRIMIESPGVVVKTGAEGVYCGLAVDSGVVVALKARDGATRASEAAIEWAMAELGLLDRPDARPLRNWTGTHVGSVRIAHRS
jgi:L-asparaginase II